MPIPPVLACCCSASAAARLPSSWPGTLTNVGNNVVDSNFADTVIQFDDGVVITHGKHVFKTGFQLWRFRMSNFYSGNSGEYGADLSEARSRVIHPLTFSLGIWVQQARGSAAVAAWHQMPWRFGGYGQDDWRIMPTLTLNLGLRYEATHSLGRTEQSPGQRESCHGRT